MRNLAIRTTADLHGALRDLHAEGCTAVDCIGYLTIHTEDVERAARVAGALDERQRVEMIRSATQPGFEREAARAIADGTPAKDFALAQIAQPSKPGSTPRSSWQAIVDRLGVAKK